MKNEDIAFIAGLGTGLLMGILIMLAICVSTMTDHKTLFEKGLVEWRADPQTGETTLHFFIDDEKVEEKN
jgi:hypothetical protein